MWITADYLNFDSWRSQRTYNYIGTRHYFFVGMSFVNCQKSHKSGYESILEKYNVVDVYLAVSIELILNSMYCCKDKVYYEIEKNYVPQVYNSVAEKMYM